MLHTPKYVLFLDRASEDICRVHANVEKRNTQGRNVNSGGTTRRRTVRFMRITIESFGFPPLPRNELAPPPPLKI